MAIGNLCRHCWVVFGKLVMSGFEGLCTEILECCRTGSAVAVPVTVVATKKIAPYRVQVMSASPDEYEQKLVDQFVLLKLAFQTHSKIGGAFIFALVPEATTWMYHLPLH